MKKVLAFFTVILFTQTACDLRPKIIAFPDSVGEFISERYPALLADPEAESEIYNSAATDYGVYAAPDLYGSPENQDYVMYASVNDYILPPQVEDEIDKGQEILVAKKEDNKSEEDVLVVPMYGGQKNAPSDVDGGGKTSTRVDLTEIVVKPGDTLYSLSRMYSIPVNDLAVMNKLSSPFELKVGKTIRVPNLTSANVAAVPVAKETETVEVKSDALKTDKTEIKSGQTETKTPVQEQKKVVKTEKKISSDPKKKLPKINSRSSSKFSWPVQGKVLSAYGAKNNGLFNDGINIAAAKGTAVKAAENGVVAYAGNEIKGMGNLIIVQHDSGWMTVYAHMDSMNVKRGTKVSVGQKIGTVGETGKVDSPQLHFEIRKGTKAYNPTSYLKK